MSAEMPEADKQLAKVETQPLAKPESEIVSLIRAAIGKGLDPTKLYDILEKEQARRAEAAFIKAKGQFQLECPPVTKIATNPQFTVTEDGAPRKATFAPLEEMQAVADPYLAGNGFTYDWTEEEDPTANICRLSFILHHEGGHSESYCVSMPIPPKAQLASAPQLKGIAVTYAMRQSFRIGTGVRVKGLDNDGNNPPPDTITVEQMQSLNDLLLKLADARGKNIEVQRPDFCAAFNIDKVGDLPADQFAKAEAMICKGLEKEKGK
jgi:hypothetical protein